MNKFFVLGFLLCLCGTAAAGVFKWTDENGKVHYGDKSEDTKKGTRLKTTAPEVPVTKEAPIGSTSRDQIQENGTVVKQVDNLQKCLQMARIQANKNSMNQAEIRADSKMLLDLCPATSYSCVTYLERPEANKCAAEQLQPGGSIIRNTTYRR